MPVTEQPNANPEQQPHTSAKGRRVMRRLLIIFVVAGLLWALYWLIFLRGTESTDDAYVAGNQLRIAPRVNGTVREILVDNTDLVEAGQVLVRLDTADAGLALSQARSDLADTVRRTANLMAERDRLTAMIDVREKELVMNQNDYQRRLKLRAGTSVTAEELNHYKEQTAIAEANLRAARHELEGARRLLLDTPLAEQPEVRQSADRLRQAWLNLKRCEIKSPDAGQVARRTVQVGAQISIGAPLMVVTPLSEVWVDANFKEVQLARFRPGQKAVVKADFYDGKVRHRGRVAGLSSGTGSVFSLLPPENATGNWIKVVQRVPVKIELDPDDLAAAPLILGLSCQVEVDLNSDVQELRPRQIYRTEVYDEDPAEIDAEIAGIIDANTPNRESR